MGGQIFNCDIRNCTVKAFDPHGLSTEVHCRPKTKPRKYLTPSRNSPSRQVRALAARHAIAEEDIDGSVFLYLANII